MISTNSAAIGTYSRPAPNQPEPERITPMPTITGIDHHEGPVVRITAVARTMPAARPRSVWRPVRADPMSVGYMLTSAPSGA